MATRGPLAWAPVPSLPIHEEYSLIRRSARHACLLLPLLLAACAAPPAPPLGTTPPTPVRVHALDLVTTGGLVAWGDNTDAQLDAPPLPTGLRYTVVAGAGRHSLAIRSDGSLVGWGRNEYGQTDVPALPAGVTYTAAAGGLLHSVGLRSDGQVVAWGYADERGLTTVPPLPAGVTYTDVAAGDYLSVALRSDGHVVAWGDDYGGQTAVPALAAGLTYTAVAAGGSQGVALRSDGQLVVWGAGAGSVPAPGTAPYVAVASGSSHALALRADGRVTAWGNNLYGQVDVPALPAGLRYTAVAAGGAQSVALRSDGQVVSWGRTYGTPAGAPTPAAGTAYTAVAAGLYHRLAVLTPLPAGSGVPGVPSLKAGSVTPHARGPHTLVWAPPGGTHDAVRYTLEHADSDDVAYSVAATDLDVPEVTVTEAEGTWTYCARVQGGTPSPSSAPVKVDLSAPSAPTAVFDGTDIDGWYRDSVTVSFAGGVDPVLADGSAGSGVTAWAGGATITQSGVHPYAGVAVDAVGNRSSPVTGSVWVDASPPRLTLTCPATPVVLGQAAAAQFGAVDDESGVLGEASGALPLDPGSEPCTRVPSTGSVTRSPDRATTRSCVASGASGPRWWRRPSSMW